MGGHIQNAHSKLFQDLTDKPQGQILLPPLPTLPETMSSEIKCKGSQRLDSLLFQLKRYIFPFVLAAWTLALLRMFQATPTYIVNAAEPVTSFSIKELYVQPKHTNKQFLERRRTANCIHS